MKYIQNGTNLLVAYTFSKNYNPNYFAFWGNFSTNGNSDSYLFFAFCPYGANYTVSECGFNASLNVQKYGSDIKYSDHNGVDHSCGSITWTDNNYHLVELRDISATGYYGFFEIWVDGLPKCDAEFINKQSSFAYALTLSYDNARTRTFWMDNFISAYFVTANATVPPAPVVIPNAASYCATSTILYVRGYDVADNGSAILNEKYYACDYGCANSTITALGLPGCKESPFLLYLMLIIAVVLLLSVIRWVFS
jgi:hypothetical protein